MNNGTIIRPAEKRTTDVCLEKININFLPILENKLFFIGELRKFRTYLTEFVYFLRVI